MKAGSNGLIIEASLVLFRVIGSPPTHDPALSLQSHTPGDAPSALLCNRVSAYIDRNTWPLSSELLSGRKWIVDEQRCVSGREGKV